MYSTKHYFSKKKKNPITGVLLLFKSERCIKRPHRGSKALHDSLTLPEFSKTRSGLIVKVALWHFKCGESDK